MGLYILEVLIFMIVGVLVVMVTLLIISVKTMTLLIHITRSNISAISWRPVIVVKEARVPRENHRPWAINWKDMYICPGHTVTKKKKGKITPESVYDVPQEDINGRQYDTIASDDVRQNNSRTDEKQIFQHQLSQQSMQVPIYHDIATMQTASEINGIAQRNNNVRKSQITVV